MCFTCFLVRLKRIHIASNCTNTNRATTVHAWFTHATLNQQQPTIQKLKLGHAHWSNSSSKKSFVWEHFSGILTDTNINNRPDSEVIITVHRHTGFTSSVFSSFCLLWHMWKDLSKRFHQKTTIVSLFYVHTHLSDLYTRAWINQKRNTYTQAYTGTHLSTSQSTNQKW